MWYRANADEQMGTFPLPPPPSPPPHPHPPHPLVHGYPNVQSYGLVLWCAAPAAQSVAFKSFGGIVNLDPIGARHALALAVVAARKVCCTAVQPSAIVFTVLICNAICIAICINNCSQCASMCRPVHFMCLLVIRNISGVRSLSLLLFVSLPVIAWTCAVRTCVC